jgi:hypothetical protein
MFVMVMIGMAVPQATIAGMIGDKGVSEATLVKHFSRELTEGRERFVASVKGQLAKAAQNGSVRAQTYLLDRLGGPEFQPKSRTAEIEVPVQISGGDARVTIFLPDNGRSER